MAPRPLLESKSRTQAPETLLGWVVRGNQTETTYLNGPQCCKISKSKLSSNWQPTKMIRGDMGNPIKCLPAEPRARSIRQHPEGPLPEFHEVRRQHGARVARIEGRRLRNLPALTVAEGGAKGYSPARDHQKPSPNGLRFDGLISTPGANPRCSRRIRPNGGGHLMERDRCLRRAPHRAPASTAARAAERVLKCCVWRFPQDIPPVEPGVEIKPRRGR